MKCSNIRFFILRLQLLASSVLFIAARDQIVCSTALVFLTRSVLIDFCLETVYLEVVLRLHAIIALLVASETLLSELRVLVLFLIESLLAVAGFSDCEIFVESVRLYKLTQTHTLGKSSLLSIHKLTGNEVVRRGIRVVN